jgi:acetyl esterase/lipase
MRCANRRPLSVRLRIVATSSVNARACLGLALSAFLICAASLATGLRAQTLRDAEALPTTKPMLVTAYGSQRLEYGELRLPPGKGPFPVAVIVHGGCWTKGHATLRYMAPLAGALTDAGIATWNIEYRQKGDIGGGWPGTFEDWANATDYLRVLARTQPIDLRRVVVIGHSAGGHAALWIASRGRLPSASAIRGRNPLAVRAAVDIDGPSEFTRFIAIEKRICDGPVVERFMGATPKERPERYAQADPFAHLPLRIPQYLVSSTVLSPAEAEEYRRAALNTGDAVSVLVIADGTHFDVVTPGTAAWARVEPFILRAINLVKILKERREKQP